MLDYFYFIGTREELAPLLAHMLDGKDFNSWSPEESETSKQGKGCRELTKKAFYDEQEVCS